MGKIEIKNLSAEYEDKNGKFLALKDISFTVENGEFVSIIGSSGCGKSTLLGILQGINNPSAGSALIDGKKITGPGLDRSVVFQHYSLFPWMNVRKNVTFGIKQSENSDFNIQLRRYAALSLRHAFSKKAKTDDASKNPQISASTWFKQALSKKLLHRERNKKADLFLEKVGLTGFAHKYPFQLSGGMQQRAAIARALAMNTDILLMDEPFGAIDAKNRANMQELLLSLWEGDDPSKKKTVIFVTHDIDEAIFLSDRIIMLTNSPGQIAKEFEVRFPRPRIHSTIRETGAYINLRNKLMALFYDENEGAVADEGYTI